MVGATITVKLPALVVVAAELVTERVPLVAPGGTAALISVSAATVKLAVAPLNLTALAEVKLVPWIWTGTPVGALVGEKNVIVGATITVKLPALVAVAAGLVTERVPLVAPAGTVALTKVSAATVKLAVVPLNLTALAELKLV